MHWIHSILPCFLLVNNQPLLSNILHYSYRLDGVQLFGGKRKNRNHMNMQYKEKESQSSIVKILDANLGFAKILLILVSSLAVLFLISTAYVNYNHMQSLIDYNRSLGVPIQIVISWYAVTVEPVVSPGQVPPVIHSPLEQFSILPLIPMNIGTLYFSFTNSSLFMLLTLSLVLLLVHFVTKNGGGNLVPNAWQSLVELIYDFVLNLVNEQIGGLSGNVKQKFFPCILVTFLFLLFCNLQGMIPYSFTVTSHFLITLGLSFSIFIGITIVGFQRNGLHFLSFSLPAGVPLPLAPFLVLLELIPHCFRALSSGIRLFANMMAGHSSVKILSGSAWTMLCMNNLFYFIGDPGPLFIVLALTGPELGVAISQAHVSTILICIYLNDAINLH
ncbi:hypothetical protein Ddye_004744 [Dipteronia dyeriana]|uniref:F-ATPase protein 6 n=1 Tax=Dipteronia dyeriana TaxID=168575 RepID=A0AAE0CP17_9ROSI|nr:hypothetical protein Ddye_004744 [Dipteronia dyeriana]